MILIDTKNEDSQLLGVCVAQLLQHHCLPYSHDRHTDLIAETKV